MVPLAVAGAILVLIWRFLPQNGAPSRCKICSCCRSSAVEKENDLRLAKKIGASLAFFWKNCGQFGAKFALIWCKMCDLVRSSFKIVLVAAAKRGGLEVDAWVEGWRHRVNK